MSEVTKPMPNGIFRLYGGAERPEIKQKQMLEHGDLGKSKFIFKN